MCNTEAGKVDMDGEIEILRGDITTGALMPS